MQFKGIVLIVLLLNCFVLGESAPPGDNDSSPGCSEDCRTLPGILWSCVVTIFACTWISVHPNVPGRNITRKGWFSGALVRTKVMGIAILTPEVVVAWAILQFRVAREVYLLGQYITFSIVSCRAYSEGSQTSSRTPYPYGHMGSTLSLRERNPFSDH